MSGYADMMRDDEQARWLNEWVPSDDPMLAEIPLGTPDDFREQYRFTLARARAAEAQLERHRSTFRALNAVLRECAT